MEEQLLGIDERTAPDEDNDDSDDMIDHILLTFNLDDGMLKSNISQHAAKFAIFQQKRAKTA
jgi:hypothetical protein